MRRLESNVCMGLKGIEYDIVGLICMVQST